MNDASGPSALLRGPFAVDAHVHLHPVFEIQAFLDGAATHVSRVLPPGTPGPSATTGILLLAEGRHEGAFARLRSATAGEGRSWTIDQTSEPESLLARKDGALRLIIAAGRQLVTAEGIEVLGLLSGDPLRDGRSLADTLAEIADANAVPVLPWGFGKWTMRRGAMVDAVLRTSPRGLFLGDNGGRLARAPTPALLREARRLGVPILPGSDPLPFPDHQTRAGSFGFIADAMLDESQPAQGLRAWLRGLGTQPPTYGALERFGAFCWNQARMQWRKRVIRSG